MYEIINELQHSWENNEIKMKNNRKDIIHQFQLYLIKKENIQEINQLANYSKIITIDQIEYTKEIYSLICFDKQLLIIQQNDFMLLDQFFENNKDSYIYFLNMNNTNFKKLQKQNSSIHFLNGKMNYQIDNLCCNFIPTIPIKNTQFLDFWYKISPVISVNLIKKGHLNSKTNRFNNYKDFFKAKQNEIKFDENDFIVFENLGSGSSSIIKLAYNIRDEKLYVLKMMRGDEKDKLIKREYENYNNIHHPLILQCFDKISFENNECLILEFIEGTTLSQIDALNLNMNEKLKIIFELMITIEYLHNNEFIYRDLKPNNIILEKDNKIPILIDFDRMIHISNVDENDNNYTALFSKYIAPELNNKESFSYSADIFSIGEMINFLFEKEFERIDEKENQQICFLLKNIYNKCSKIDPKERPTISSLINEFYLNIFVNVSFQITEKETIETNKNIHSNKYSEYWFLIAENKFSFAHRELSILYQEGKIIPPNLMKASSYASFYCEKENPDAQYNIGVMYQRGYYVKTDINKAIYYYTLAADRNHERSQYYLGLYYYEGQIIKRDITKSLHYLTLSAKNNNTKAKHILGYLYERGEVVKRDIEKSIYYYTQASNDNNYLSQYNLGLIYYNCISKKDINKSIHYFTLAANNNYSDAQFMLGNIYLSKETTYYNINKAIEYYHQAAKNNNIDSQFKLGIIYYEGKYIKHDIEKAINYLTEAAKNNHPKAQSDLGLIYLNGKYIQPNVTKSLKYLNLAAKNNISDAQYNLGLIYHEGKFNIPKDIDRAIYYYTMASNNNNCYAQNNLGSIYMKKNEYYAIYYLTLASNNNFALSQYQLGTIYSNANSKYYDMKKAIFYFNLAASKFEVNSLLTLAVFYFNGDYVKQDKLKAIHYLTLAANYGDLSSKFILGLFNINAFIVPRNINKGINYLLSASDKYHYHSIFHIAVIFHQGILVSQDILKAIHYYKEITSLNNNYAKNNLALIYKNGFGDKVQKNIVYAITLLEEAVKQKNDNISMFNLASIYFYEANDPENIKKSIFLLSNLLDIWSPSGDLLILILIQKLKPITLNKIRNEMNSIGMFKEDTILKLYNTIKKNNLEDDLIYNNLYNIYRNRDFYYNFDMFIVLSKDFFKSTKKENIVESNNKLKNLNRNFYEGFGCN